MKPIAIHLDRLSQALSAKGIELKRTDLLQVAAAAFGYHNQNEASAASQRGDLTPPTALPVCRIPVPAMPNERTLVVLQDGDSGMVYGIDSAFLDSVTTERATRYAPTPFGGLADLSHASAQPASAWNQDQKLAGIGHLDRAVREAETLKEQLDAITGADDDQADQIGQAENTLSRLLTSLRGGADLEVRRRDEDGHTAYTPAERASHARDIDGMSVAVDDLTNRLGNLALLTPETATWAQDCVAALGAGLRIAESWKKSYESEVRFGPDWRAWTKDLKKASTRGATPLSDLDLHKIRHAVADNHCKSSGSERSQVQWRVGQLMERHGRALLLRLDIAEAQLAGELPPIRGSAHVPKDSLWRVDAAFPGKGLGREYAAAFYRVSKSEDPETVGTRIAKDIAGEVPLEMCKIRRAPREEAALRLLDAARQAHACIPEDSPARKALLSAIANGDRTLPSVIGNPVPQPAPEPASPPSDVRTSDDDQNWLFHLDRSAALQDSIVTCAEGYAIDRRGAIAALSKAFGFDYARSVKVLDREDAGVRSDEFTQAGHPQWS